jgi:hypothetical protein
LLGCTTQTIANWIEKGAIKGHTIDKYVFVDKQSIEALFDTASEVAQMEKKLQELKSEISKELTDREQDLVDLRNDKLTTPQKQFLRNVIDNCADIANDIIDEVDKTIITGYLQGKSNKQIASELNMSGNLTHHRVQKAIDIFLTRLDYSSLREENKQLNAKLESLQEEIVPLRDKVESMNITRRILGTPFALNIVRLGFPVRITNTLADLGCRNLADVVRLDLDSLHRNRKIGLTSMRKLDALLVDMGLYSGMDLNVMSDEDFSVLVDKLKQTTSYATTTTDDANLSPDCYSSKILRNTVGRQEKTISDLKDKNAILQDRNVLLQESNVKLQEEIEELKNSKVELEKIDPAKLSAARKNEKLLNAKSRSLTSALSNACRSLDRLQSEFDSLRKEIKKLQEVNLQDYMPEKVTKSNRTFLKKMSALYKYKEDQLIAWKKTLEAELSASVNLNRTQKALIDGLQVENFTNGTDPIITK